MIVLSTCTPIKHHNNTPFMENLNPKCDKNKYKKYQILKLQNENEIKNKIFTCKLYPFNIEYLMHIAKNCLHYPSLKDMDFLKQYN
jgi:hypothetical protein